MTSRQIHIQVPSEARTALHVIENAGFEAWIVGGFVRDSIMGRKPGDLDIAASCHWTETQRAFENAGYRTCETGIKHGTLTVIIDDLAIEITTYRLDGNYSDGRHPDEVQFVQSIEEDLARRDFTINAIAYHPQRGIYDPFDGVGDIEKRRIRTVGNPDTRFEEDKLRILRAIRFRSQLGFSIDSDTINAMNRQASGLAKIAIERQVQELNKLLCGFHAGETIIEHVLVLGSVIPEILPMKDFDQRTPFHCYDVLEHTCHVVDLVDRNALQRWAALLHDIGKPDVFTIDSAGQGHFKGHSSKSAEIAKEIAKRLKMSSLFTQKMLLLIELHDIPIIPNAIEVKKALRSLNGDERLLCDLCKLKLADATARTPLYGRPRVHTAKQLMIILEHIIENNQVFRKSDLAISGNDLLSLGMKPGPEIGRMLDMVLDAVIEEKIDNRKETLIDFVKNALHGYGNR